MLIIFTGNGKGKTTAAIGQALRAIGNGSRVLMVQLIKGPWESGEDKSSRKFGDDFHIVKMGKGFVKTPCDKLPIEEHIKAAHDALAFSLKELKTGKWDILIMDEIWVAQSLGLLTAAEVSAFIDRALIKCEHLIMTGRGCPKQFMERADLVTEMCEIKHPYALGVRAARGVEY
ncbi:MAG TPA: cob(I)yrinic acid a,c-diamide adenosyltransferase [Candidatus Paceibacterota bacterium]|nr:cob(I)yrinic acid a,c-diamide adenosyltransferase [Candidatus Paceibacterota bacterium]